jgi:hypothetical protein
MRNIAFDGSRAHLLDVPHELKEQLRKRLLERRVVQHVPASMEGMRVEDNTRGVVSFDEESGKVTLCKKGEKPTYEVPGKLIGYSVEDSKLRKQKGVRVIEENFGVALTVPPQVIRWHKVYPQLHAMQEASAGKWPKVWRKGDVLCIPREQGNELRRIAGIDENTRDGIIIKLRTLDGMERPSESRVSSLLRAKAFCLKGKYTGDVLCRTTSSISEAQPSA